VPIYEYTCLTCEREFEKLVTAGATVACPACGAERVMKKLSLFRARTAVSAGSAPSPGAAPTGGGCCGGGCGCH
jgi:putative FmdB family regulatory protein